MPGVKEHLAVAKSIVISSEVLVVSFGSYVTKQAKACEHSDGVT